MESTEFPQLLSFPIYELLNHSDVLAKESGEIMNECRIPLLTNLELPSEIFPVRTNLNLQYFFKYLNQLYQLGLGLKFRIEIMTSDFSNAKDFIVEVNKIRFATIVMNENNTAVKGVVILGAINMNTGSDRRCVAYLSTDLKPSRWILFTDKTI